MSSLRSRGAMLMILGISVLISAPFAYAQLGLTRAWFPALIGICSTVAGWKMLRA